MCYHGEVYIYIPCQKHILNPSSNALVMKLTFIADSLKFRIPSI